MVKKKSDLYICPVCESIITWEDILEDCKNGGVGMCMCEFMLKDNKGNICYPRVYHSYLPLKDYERKNK